MHDLDDRAWHLQSALTRDADFIDYRAQVCTARRPAAGHLRLRRARLDRERPPLHRLPDGLADGGDLSVRVRALRGAGATCGTVPTATSRSRSTTTRATSTTSTGWSPASRIRSPTSRSTSGRTSTRSCASSSSRASRAQGGFAESFPEHRAVQRGDRLHRQGRRPRSQGRRLSVLRHRARGRAPVVGAPGSAGQRAGRRVHHREPRRVLGADGAEAQVRRREDAPVPQVRARPLPRRAAAPSRRASSRCCAPTAPRTCTTRRARWRSTRCRTRSARRRWTTRCRRSSRRWRFKGPPYATSRDLVAELRRVTPPAQPGADRRPLRDDHALRPARGERRGAEARPTASTTSTSSSPRRRSAPTAPATRQDAPLDVPIDIGVQDAKGNFLLLEKRRVRTGENRFTLDGRRRRRRGRASTRCNKLIDRDDGDNTVAVDRP